MLLWQVLIRTRQALVSLLLSLQHWLHPARSGMAVQWTVLQRTKGDIARVEENSFLAIYRRQVPASSVLEPLHVAVEFTHTRAVIMRVPGNAYDVIKYPFFYNGVFREATTKTTLRLQDFNSLLDETPWPDVRLIWLWSVGRCGSTLLANLFTSFNGFRAISEPDDIFMVSKLKTQLSEEDYERTLKNALKYHLVQMKKRWPETKYIIIKPRSLSFWYITNPSEIAKKTTHIFMYRDVYPVLKSYIAAFGRLFNIIRADSLLGQIFGVEKIIGDAISPMCDVFTSNSQLKETHEKIESKTKQSKNLFVRFAFAGLPYLHALYRNLTDGMEPHELFAVKYERLIQDPVGQFETIAAKMATGFSFDDAERQTLVALSKEDSQKNSVISKDSVSRFKQESLPEELKAAFDDVMRLTGQEEDLERGFLLPNTV